VNDRSTSEAPEKKPPVRRRRAVKKSKPEAEPADTAPAPTYDEEEEFSDFSF
jgi:hypothetical protein